MFRENTLSKIKSLFIPLFLFFLFCSVSHAQKPILTDEFDRFLVTKETKIGDIIGISSLYFRILKRSPGALCRRYQEVIGGTI